MQSEYALNIYPRAAEDMEGIFEYIAVTLCNPTAAVKQIHDFEQALESCGVSQPESRPYI